jgi:hypothetical protein
MKNFKTGDFVIATIPTTKGNCTIYCTIVSETKNLVTCVYLNSQNEPISLMLPSEWLALLKQEPKLDLPPISVHNF